MGDVLYELKRKMKPFRRVQREIFVGWLMIEGKGVGAQWPPRR